MLMAVGRGSNGRGQRDRLRVARCFKFDFCCAVTLMTAGAISVSLRRCPLSLGGTRVAEVVPLNYQGGLRGETFIQVPCGEQLHRAWRTVGRRHLFGRWGHCAHCLACLET